MNVFKKIKDAMNDTIDYVKDNTEIDEKFDELKEQVTEAYGDLSVKANELTESGMAKFEEFKNSDAGKKVEDVFSDLNEGTKKVVGDTVDFAQDKFEEFKNSDIGQKIGDTVNQVTDEVKDTFTKNDKQEDDIVEGHAIIIDPNDADSLSPKSTNAVAEQQGDATQVAEDIAKNTPDTPSSHLEDIARSAIDATPAEDKIEK